MRILFGAIYMDWQWRWPYGKWAQQIAHISVLCIANDACDLFRRTVCYILLQYTPYRSKNARCYPTKHIGNIFTIYWKLEPSDAHSQCWFIKAHTGKQFLFAWQNSCYVFHSSMKFYFLDFVKKNSICLKIYISKRHFAIVKIQIYGR